MHKPEGSEDFVNTTFKEFFVEVQKISLGLNALGVTKGDKIGLIADVGHRWMRVSLGINCIGGVDVPRGTDATEEDLSYIFKHADCNLIFLEHGKVLEKIKHRLSEFKSLKTIVFFNKPEGKIDVGGLQSLTLEELIKKGAAVKDRENKFEKIAKSIGEEDLACIIYTSGTTGAPKGVMHTQKSLTWEIVHSIEGVNVEPNGVTMGLLPPWHIAERLIEMSAIRTVTGMAFTNIASLGKDLQTVRPTFLLSVPRVWEATYAKILDGVKKAPGFARALFSFARAITILFSEQKDRLTGAKYTLTKPNPVLNLLLKPFYLLNLILLFIPYQLGYAILGKIRKNFGGRVKFALSGAGALPEHIDRFFYAAGIPIIETYGMTETVGVTCRREIPPRLTIGTVGSPLPGTQIKLLDEQGKEITEPNVKGVAWHHGPHIMKGYYKDEEKTKAVLTEDGWLNSGDILVWTGNGRLKFAGRAKDTIVLIGGENVEPLPIEDSLKQSAFIQQVVVVGQDRKTLGALIVPDKEILRNHLGEQGVEIPENVPDWNAIPEVKALIKAEVKEHNSSQNGFKSFEKVTGIHMLAKEFEIGDEMTQTLKIRRNVVFEKYEKEIENLYS